MTDHDPGPAAFPDPPPSEPTASPPPAALSVQDTIPEEGSTPAAEEFTPLDPRVVHLWRIDQAVGWGFLLLLLLGGAGLFYFMESAWASLAVLAWGFCAVLTAGFVVWYPARMYREWGYRIDGRALEIRSGLVYRSLRLLPLSRIQHVDLQRGPFERMLGLASLVLYTAGTRSASISLPGLKAEEAIRLRDHLLAIGGDDAV